ncbi:MAG: HAD-IIA family hydrolase, partial [Actinobacteria bacterium]|nr:HAD-IIA family hydrolase [Actinomycetota bacterium]
AYDVAMLDLDGVVYVGRQAVPAAPDALARARADGMRLAFVTNNAARPPVDVATHLGELGVPAEVEDIITSAQVAAHYLARRLPAGAAVLVLGTTGLIEALTDLGLRPVFRAEDEPLAVVQGYSPTLNYEQLAEGVVAIRRGAQFVATNLDPTVPSPRGPLPGNGSFVTVVQTASGVVPKATGKPDPTMHQETLERTAAKRPIVVGDRLDTDIEGANAVGCDSLLVFSGVSQPSDLLSAEPRYRPTYLAADVSGLLVAHPPIAIDDGGARCGRWRADAELRLTSSDPAATDPGTPEVVASTPTGSARFVADDLDALRALCAVAWTGDRGSAPPAGTDSEATATLRRLGWS